MHNFKIIRWFLIAWFVCLLGCSSLHVDSNPAFDWKTVSAVVLHAPEEDPWLLAPAIRAELQRMGYEVLAAGTGKPDLQVRYFFEEGPDLDTNGNLLTRIKSLHIQFVDPDTEKFVAVADYFYAEDSPAPLKGVAEAFAGIRGGKPTPSKAVSQPVSPLLETSRQQQSTNDQQSSLPVPHVAAPQATNDALLSSAPLEAATNNPMPQTEPQEEPLVPVTVKPKTREIAPDTRNPWIPRLESWGFENWGEPSED